VYDLIAAGIFVLICGVIAWHYAHKRSYKEDSVKYLDKKNEVDHVLQQRLDIEKLKASKRVKVESGPGAGTVLGGLMSLVIAVVVMANVTMPLLQAMNTTGFNTSEIALFGVVLLGGVGGVVYTAATMMGAA